MGAGAPSPVWYRGGPLPVRSGETLARALLRSGQTILGRSIRYHRPRAPFCGVGHCTGCLVRVNGNPNVRACRYVPSPGDRVESENAWPSPSFDLLAGFDLAFPSGIDTLRGFTRPAFAAPLYQRVIRRLAGYGHLADAGAPSHGTGLRLDADTVVVGAGNSGRAFATAWARSHPGLLAVERELGVPPIPDAEILEGTTAVFLPPPAGPADRPFLLVAARSNDAVEIRARQVVVASGGYDGPLLFEGNDRPGVITAEGALALAPESDRAPFRAGILVGGGSRAAELLERWGGSVEALVAPGTVGPEATRPASELGIPIYPRTLILGVDGRRRVRGVRLAPRGFGTPFTVEGDAVVLAHRRLPNPQLFFQAGARMEWRGEGGAYYPLLDADLTTSVPGLFAIGEAAGFVGAAAGLSGDRLASVLSREGPAPTTPLERVGTPGPNELEGYYRELLGRTRTRGKTIACPCEDVLLSEIEDATRHGYRGIEVVKRYTGVGTGLCQGRYCLPDALLLLSVLEGRAPEAVGYITQRPPVLPVRLGVLSTLAEPPRPEAR
ncbi:MAG: 2Fe-2S iron-sulfur cluster-binding protein [Thermoplasmata archaeon]|nr:2Fe-2S iron-sulfur cluster-binding protein [Thermoplasmata archaeon]